MNDKVNYRTCVCCKKLKHKYSMARIAVIDGNVLCDTTFKSGGRGFYICSNECLAKISSSKKFTKIFNMINEEHIINTIKGVLDVE